MTYANVLTALADPTRRAVFEVVSRHPASVTDIAAGLPVSRPAVSQHLKVLEAANLVHAVPQGRSRLYAVQPDGLNALRMWMDGLWDVALNAYAAEIERRVNKD